MRSRSSGPAPRHPGGILRLLTPEQRELFHTTQAMMSLLEGHASFVMNAVARDVVGDLPRLQAALARRRAVGGWEKRVQRAIGFDQKVAQYDAGERFVGAVVERIGMRGSTSCGRNRGTSRGRVRSRARAAGSPATWGESWRAARPPSPASLQAGHGDDSRARTVRAGRPRAGRGLGRARTACVSPCARGAPPPLQDAAGELPLRPSVREGSGADAGTSEDRRQARSRRPVRTAEGTPARASRSRRGHRAKRERGERVVGEIGAASAAEGHTRDDQAETVLSTSPAARGSRGSPGSTPAPAHRTSSRCSTSPTSRSRRSVARCTCARAATR